MKIILFVVVLNIPFLFIAQVEENLVLPKSGEIKMVYKVFKSSNYFVDSFSKWKKIGENSYCERIREYSWTNNDTAYYRKDSVNYYSMNKDKKAKETVEIPIYPDSQTWTNKDSTWIYSVKSISAKLVTPKHVYKNLIEIEARYIGKKKTIFMMFI